MNEQDPKPPKDNPSADDGRAQPVPDAELPDGLEADEASDSVKVPAPGDTLPVDTGKDD